MIPDAIRIAIILIISFIYAYFDVFNKRNIPNAFAYAGIAIAAILTLAYPLSTIIYSIITAAIVAVIFYIFYRAGQVGAGDGFELVTISLLLPIQPSTILQNIQVIVPFNSPFILSVFISTGIVTLIGVPIYYLLIAKNTGIKETKGERNKYSRQNLIKAIAILIAYLLLYASLVYLFGPNLYGAVIVLLMGIFSAITIMYSRKINSRMIAMKKASALEEGDMIAINFIDPKTLASISKKYDGFGNLVTKKLAFQLRSSSTKLPVYQNSVPLSLSIFVAVIISLLIGNLLFFVI